MKDSCYHITPLKALIPILALPPSYIFYAKTWRCLW